MQTARKAFHEKLITKFDSDVPLSVKKFLFIASMLDPRFKKLTFKNDLLLTPHMRRNAAQCVVDARHRALRLQRNARVRRRPHWRT